MSTRNRTAVILQATSCVLIALTLAACDRAPQTGEQAERAPPTAPASDAREESTPVPADVSPPEESPAAPVQPPPEAPSPAEPSPAAKPTSAVTGPALESMTLARSTGKAGVPVDLRFSFDSQPIAGQPVTLHLAAVPRVSGSNLEVSIKRVDGMQVSSTGALTARKADASGTYRQQYSMTLHGPAPTELRVLVTMDTPEGSAFGFFGIPLEAGNSSHKLNSVKQR